MMNKSHKRDTESLVNKSIISYYKDEIALLIKEIANCHNEYGRSDLKYERGYHVFRMLWNCFRDTEIYHT